MIGSAAGPQATIEITLPWGPTLRGVRWGEGQTFVLFLHEPGADLDAWGTLPRDIARALPVEARAFDLPGHGLSDDPWSPERLPEIIRESASPSDAASRTIVIAAGETSLVALGLAAEVGLAGLVCLSPTGGPEATSRSPEVPKHFFAGTQIADDLALARRLASACGGWAVVTAVPVTARGTALLKTDWGQRIAEAIAGVVRDCLLPRPHDAPDAGTRSSGRQAAP